MDKKHLPYIRVGNSYYKMVEIPLTSGDTLDSIIRWNSEFIKQDHGKDILSSISKYDGFCIVPDHLNYKQATGNFYNRYLPFDHKPCPGEWPYINSFLKHIFQEQYELGLDYIKLLVEKPIQKLPVICLVSKERNTGKTTFLQFLKAIFGGNMTINTNEDFKSNFNSEWISKLLIGVDETFLDRKEDSERLKNLSTAKLYKAEAKGQDRIEVEFFGKFVLCSNNEDGFLIIEPGETRYWVIKVNPLNKETPHFLEKLKLEIPHFINTLTNRPLTTKNESRMWFNPKLLDTPALRKVMRRNRNKLELEILSILQFIVDEKGVSKVCFCPNDIQNWLGSKGFKAVENYNVRRIIQNDWKLEPAPNSYSYTRFNFCISGIIEEPAKGRYYILTDEQIENLND
ncbi:MAG: DUF5906 domain-containing protein [Bacteroidales bacterium]|nr:DUF5906 domain-containing protein [Bacteroidales bacterium]